MSNTSLAVFSTTPPLCLVAQPAVVPLSQLERLEQQLLQANDQAQTQWIEDYLDLGLELANAARQHHRFLLHTSWLKRLYRTLRDSASLPQVSQAWRQRCVDALYQPLFALQHHYQQQDDGALRLRQIRQELAVISRYWV
ncbi:MAG: hypothetical protein IBX52_01785 [Bacterioplanes sp.]|nr:hypothetical protein [Bacterioplanes sp.]